MAGPIPQLILLDASVQKDASRRTKQQQGALEPIAPLAAAFVLQFLSIGLFAAWSEFIEPLHDAFLGAEYSYLAFLGTAVCTLSYVMSSVAAYLARGPGGYRAAILVGGATAVSAMLLSSMATEAWQFFFTYTVLYGIGDGLIYNASTLLVAGSYEHTALAMGIAQGGGMVGYGVIACANASVIANYGWRAGFRFNCGISVAATAAALIMVGTRRAGNDVTPDEKGRCEEEQLFSAAGVLGKRRQFENSPAEASVPPSPAVSTVSGEESGLTSQEQQAGAFSAGYGAAGGNGKGAACGSCVVGNLGPPPPLSIVLPSAASPAGWGLLRESSAAKWLFCANLLISMQVFAPWKFVVLMGDAAGIPNAGTVMPLVVVPATLLGSVVPPLLAARLRIPSHRAQGLYIWLMVLASLLCGIAGFGPARTLVTLALYFFANAAFQCAQPVEVKELWGAAAHPDNLAVQFFAIAIGVLLGGWTSGFVYETTNSFGAMMLFVAAFFVAGAFCHAKARAAAGLVPWWRQEAVGH